MSDILENVSHLFLNIYKEIKDSILEGYDTTEQDNVFQVGIKV